MSHPVWVYLVRGIPEGVPNNPTEAAFLRQIEEKGVPVVLDNPFGDNMRHALRETLRANWGGDSALSVTSITEAKLLGRTQLLTDILPKAFPKETR